jgi:5-methylcytosine-specific restriction protein A
MQMVRGNRAIRDHLADSKEMHLFEDIGRGNVRHLGRVVYAGHHSELASDRNRAPRQAIVFELAFDAAADGIAPDVADARRPDEGRLWQQSLEALRAAALKVAEEGASPRERKANAYRRSQAVRVYVLRRAAGICEGCGAEAPFLRPDGRPYLEPHHIRRRADGGPDHPRWVAALCPNCHRRVHCGKDGASYNSSLADLIGARESAG